MRFSLEYKREKDRDINTGLSLVCWVSGFLCGDKQLRNGIGKAVWVSQDGCLVPPVHLFSSFYHIKEE